MSGLKFRRISPFALVSISLLISLTSLRLWSFAISPITLKLDSTLLFSPIVLCLPLLESRDTRVERETNLDHYRTTVQRSLKNLLADRV